MTTTTTNAADPNPLGKLLEGIVFTYGNVLGGGDPAERALYFAELERGMVLEVDEELWDYFLNVLPPKSMGRRIAIPNFHDNVRTDFGFAEGWERITYFFTKREEGKPARYFAWRSQEINRD